MSDGPRPELQAAVVEALRSAHELCAYLVNNLEVDGDDVAPNVEFGASTLAHAEQFAALVNDAREKTGCALSLIEGDLPGEVAAATRRSLNRLIYPTG